MEEAHRDDAGSVPPGRVSGRIAVFGGSFDPPHVGHQIICLWAIATGQADAVWMVPCWEHPFGKKLSPFAARIAMCGMTAGFLRAEYGYVGVSLIEGNLKGTSYTIRTLKELIRLHPQFEFSLLIGADAYAERDQWRDFDDIARMVSVISPGRAGIDSDAPVLSGVSSTQIRKLVREGRDISMLVPAGVEKYIMEKGLYRT